ncbi:hypothetical protein H8959_015306 [Pygathrix nigripes]
MNPPGSAGETSPAMTGALQRTLNASHEQELASQGEGGSGCINIGQNMRLTKDLFYPSPEEETQGVPDAEPQALHGKKCPGCYKITTVFSQAQTVVLCVGGSTVLCLPTGEKARLTEEDSFRRKQH